MQSCIDTLRRRNNHAQAPSTSPYAVVFSPEPPPTLQPAPRRLLIDLQTGLAVAAVADDNTLQQLDPAQAHHYSQIMQQKLQARMLQ